jgi:hemolysin activation/secretion protein
VLAARSQFSSGLDALGATVNNTGTDGRFFSWLGQFQYVQSLGNDVIVARVATQLTGDSLLPLEQFSIGGVDTVRGYRQNQSVGDSGVVGSLEVRFPVVRQPKGIGEIQLVPFFDIGRVWNSNGDITKPRTLLSTGLGLRWQLNDSLSARFDYGVPLNRIKRAESSLQDQGIYFSLFMQSFR